MDFPDKTQQVGERDIQAVVSGAKQVSRPATRRFMDLAFAESPKSIAARIATDILVPNLKRGIEEAIGSFISGMLWGGSRTPSNLIRGPHVTTIGSSYSSISTAGALRQAQMASPSPVSGGYRDLALPTVRDAEMLLAKMYELINDYRVVTVAELYKAAEITPGISDRRFGWTSLDGARIEHTRDGFVLQLPRPIAL